MREPIRVILRTRPGEQLMRPDFGAGLEQLLHEPNTLATRRAIRDRVTARSRAGSARILLDRVEVWEVPERADRTCASRSPTGCAHRRAGHDSR